jgi:hypothetical protein
MTSSRTITTTDHDEIREWVEARGGYPAVVDESSQTHAGELRIGYLGYSGEEKLRRISWNEFFEELNRHNLAFFYTTQSDSDSDFDEEQQLLLKEE